MRVKILSLRNLVGGAVWSVLLPMVAWATSLSLPDPVVFRDRALANPHLRTTDGELFCWNASGAAADILRGYEATGDVRWLEGAEMYFDFLLSKLTRDPDGREGWIGKSIWGTPGRKQLDAYRIDAVVGDAILLAPMVRFAELVKNDAALASRFGAAATRYVEKAQQIGWEKWNARNTYYRDAAGYGSYRMPLFFISVETGQWVDTPVVPHSENLNKHSAMAIVMLRLWRVTGEVQYRVRAEEIFSRLKALFRFLPGEDRVVWNFWMPHGPHDIGGGKLASWVGLHPNRPNYQAEEVARMVEAYDSGIVFDAEDLRRLIRTNLFMSPTRSGGKWRTGDGSAESGKVWSSLARFDPRIRELWRATLRDGSSVRDQIERAYDDSVTAQSLHWGRSFVSADEDVRIFDHRAQPGRGISATVVIPNRVSADGDERIRLVTQTMTTGELQIDLFDRSGRRWLGELYRSATAATPNVVLPEWDGVQPLSGKKESGEFIVRWRLNEEARTERVWIGEWSDHDERPPALVEDSEWIKPVDVRASDFQRGSPPERTLDGDFTTRWTAEGNDHWIRFDLGRSHQLVAVDLAIGSGAVRRALFLLEVSDDGNTWRKVYEGASSGTTAEFERFSFAPMEARFVRYTGFGNSMNRWNNLTEARFVGVVTEEKR
jgi:hypothetical protein